MWWLHKFTYTCKQTKSRGGLPWLLSHQPIGPVLESTKSSSIPVSIKQYGSVWFRLVLCGYFFLLFPLSKAVNSAIKKWIVPCQFVTFHLGVPTRDTPCHKRRGVARPTTLAERMGWLAPLFPHSVHPLIQQNLSTQCDKQPHVNNNQQKLLDVLYWFLGCYGFFFNLIGDTHCIAFLWFKLLT